jgi:hypothetical protein
VNAGYNSSSLVVCIIAHLILHGLLVFLIVQKIMVSKCSTIFYLLIIHLLVSDIPFILYILGDSTRSQLWWHDAACTFILEGVMT